MSEVFHIIPASLRGLSFIGGFSSLVMIVVVVGVNYVLYCTYQGSRHTQFEITQEGLQIRGDLWGRRVPKSSLRLEKARLVNLNETPEMKPKWRTCGTSIGGYQSGWYRLCNGEKALLYLTNRQQAVYVPTLEGYSLLLSVEQPDRFLDALKREYGGSLGPAEMAVKGAHS